MQLYASASEFTAWSASISPRDQHSKIEPRIAVGDGVEVLAQGKDDGTVVALAIGRQR